MGEYIYKLTSNKVRPMQKYPGLNFRPYLGEAEFAIIHAFLTEPIRSLGPHRWRSSKIGAYPAGGLIPEGPLVCLG
jgi:hypothetical protein